MSEIADTTPAPVLPLAPQLASAPRRAVARDFDADRRHWAPEDRTFLLGGEEFTARENVRPEVLALYEDRVRGDRTLGDIIAVSDECILLMIEGGDAVDREGQPVPGSARARYLELRAREEDPIDLDTLAKITEWMFEVYAVRPTQPAAASSNGAGNTGTSSTVSSSPPAVAAVQMG